MDVDKILNSLDGKNFTDEEVKEFVEKYYNNAGTTTVTVFDDPAKFYTASKDMHDNKKHKETFLEGNFSDKCWIEDGKKKWTVSENNEIDWKEYDIIGDVEGMLMDAFQKSTTVDKSTYKSTNINNFGFCVGQLYTPEVSFFHKGIFCMFVYNGVKIIGKGKKKIEKVTGKTIAYVLQAPACKLNDELKLHSVKSPAIAWGDRINEYYIHGVRFDEQMWTDVSARKMSNKEVIAIQNIEQRRVACKHYGNEKIFKALNPVLKHKSKRGNELFEVTFASGEGNNWRRKQLILRYKDPSTTRVYLSGVPRNDDDGNEITNADQAMAWKFSISKEQYDLLIVEG
ncbi:MAG: hypothetical protein CL489_11870 [Acidobacteria bacterium]|nr:hypothetical protein [Acidobacteriota bacterium]|tara:strand:+ start:1118 stop:2140 length:1023 start_codon:yes stop_codon:yes gene_type:complete